MELQTLDQAPFDVGPRTLFIAFKAESDLQCFRSLGWRLPSHTLDLYSEWRWRSNGTPNPLPENSLINVATRYGIDTMTAVMKNTFRQMFIDDAVFTPEQRKDALDYCQADVSTTWRLYLAMCKEMPFIIPAAVYRGRYTKAASRVQHIGVPLDLQTERGFRRNRMAIRARIIDEGDRDFGVFDKDYSFSNERFEAMLIRRGVTGWPRTEKAGFLSHDQDVLRKMAKKYPWLEPWRRMITLADILENWPLQCGEDGFNRYSVMPFGTRTGRNSPSSNRYIFGLPSGLRPLIKPHEGMAVAYCDWCSQEIGVASSLSGDPAMRADFVSGDPYVSFAIRAGVPESQAKQVRKAYKTALLGICYGMGAHALAARISVDVGSARTLLRQVEQHYPVFWAWCRRVQATANWRGEIVTPFDKWRMQVHSRTKPTTVRNYMMQATGASIMRLSAIVATEEGLDVGGIVHDAFLLVATEENIEHNTAHLLEIMAGAAKKVCDLTIPAEPKIIRYPDRYWDSDDTEGCALWHQLTSLLRVIERASDRVPEPVLVEG
jgi:hypothetical protein